MIRLVHKSVAVIRPVHKSVAVIRRTLNSEAEIGRVLNSEAEADAQTKAKYRVESGSEPTDLPHQVAANSDGNKVGRPPSFRRINRSPGWFHDYILKLGAEALEAKKAEVRGDCAHASSVQMVEVEGEEEKRRKRGKQMVEGVRVANEIIYGETDEAQKHTYGPCDFCGKEKDHHTLKCPIFTRL